MTSDATRFGYTAEQWQQAVDTGVETLIGVARDGGMISYTDLCNRIYDHTDVAFVPGEYALPYLLGDISASTLESDGIAITTLVTYAGTTEAGEGLFALAVEHGLLPKNPTPDQKLKFRMDHMNAAYARWPRVRRRPGARFRQP